MTTIDKQKNDIKKHTGKTLQQWGNEYGVSRERVRQLYNRWGTINDDLMMNRNVDRNVGGRHKHIINGRTYEQWGERWNLSAENVFHKHKDWGTLNDELFSKRPRLHPNHKYYKNPLDDPKLRCDSLSHVQSRTP